MPSYKRRLFSKHFQRLLRSHGTEDADFDATNLQESGGSQKYSLLNSNEQIQNFAFIKVRLKSISSPKMYPYKRN